MAIFYSLGRKEKDRRKLEDSELMTSTFSNAAKSACVIEFILFIMKK